MPLPEFNQKYSESAKGRLNAYPKDVWCRIRLRPKFWVVIKRNFIMTEEDEIKQVQFLCHLCREHHQCEYTPEQIRVFARRASVVHGLSMGAAYIYLEYRILQLKKGDKL